jgi:hypothetical protein
MPRNVTADVLAFPFVRRDHGHSKGGRPGRGPGLWGTGYGVEVGDSIRKWVDVETYFLWHEHDSCAAAILRDFRCFTQATMAVIILSPP